ncbi:acyl-CoA dehydrogenase family protein [Brevibacillus laterosporus]|uniref:Acyl-CoA dehydrogenase n=1 Tax=Brevibacillus laterosporus TaxID=1465 RepID=A0A0F7EIZ5_BRELA|nr:acyl-CoA dehydrogenase family protein [Brevibacillus laterosporus]AKF95953.1 acyl-CoA dehydrogenase [Brevibacillus laterosporus]
MNNLRQAEMIELVREFANREIRPYASAFEDREELPQELFEKMAKKGYLAASFPKQYGGLGLNAIDYGHFTEVIGKACNSVRELITVHTSLVGESLLRFGSEEQKKKWLTAMSSGEKIGAFALSEPNIGSDAKGVQTTYRKEGKKYILNGRKKWISFADIADFFVVIASNEDKVTAFLVERDFPGVKTSRMQGLIVSKSSHIAEIELSNVEVSEENVLGQVGGGFNFVVSTALDSGRYSIAWAGVALAQEALENMVNYSRSRTQYNKKICEFDQVQAMITTAVTNIHASRALCLAAGKMRLDKHPNAMIETTIAKYHASKVAMQVTTDAVQIHGANGLHKQYPVERLFREAKVLEIIEGTSQVLQPIIAQFGITNYYQMT